MADISLQTVQNVHLDFELAGIGNRLIAQIIDYSYMLAYAFVMFLIIRIVDERAFDRAATSVLLLPVFLYHLIFEVFMDGQSPGKRQKNIRVMMADGSQASFPAYALRWLLGLVELTSGGSLALGSMAVTTKRQRLGDLAAGTIVVKAKKMDSFDKSMFEAEIDEEYSPVYPNIKYVLKEEEADLIDDALKVYALHGKSGPAELLREKLEPRLGQNSELNAIDLLSLMVKDYRHYQLKSAI